MQHAISYVLGQANLDSLVSRKLYSNANKLAYGYADYRQYQFSDKDDENEVCHEEQEEEDDDYENEVEGEREDNCPDNDDCENVKINSQLGKYVSLTKTIMVIIIPTLTTIMRESCILLQADATTAVARIVPEI